MTVVAIGMHRSGCLGGCIVGRGRLGGCLRSRQLPAIASATGLPVIGRCTAPGYKLAEELGHICRCLQGVGCCCGLGLHHVTTSGSDVPYVYTLYIYYGSPFYKHLQACQLRHTLRPLCIGYAENGIRILAAKSPIAAPFSVPRLCPEEQNGPLPPP